MLKENKNSKYVTIYNHNKENDNLSITINEANLNSSSESNYRLNKARYGDAIIETSNSGINATSWNTDYSFFPGLDRPFVSRGGILWNGYASGIFCFYYSGGSSGSNGGFRPVLVST